MTWPRPAAEVLAEMYSARDYYIARGMDDGVVEGATLRAREILEQSKRPVRRILDFGAGEGHLVAAFRALGIDARGVEPSPAGRSEARRRYGIELWEALPETRPRDCDAIVLVHSLEHVEDPLRTLRSLLGWLAPGGTVFIEVPNVKSFEMLRPERRRIILSLPIHLYHFTPKTLGAVLEAAGFRVVCAKLTNPAWLEWLLALRARMNGAQKARSLAAPATDPVSSQPVGSFRRRWRQEILPWIRSRFPGWTFQVVAIPDRVHSS